MKININTDWNELLLKEFKKPYFKNLTNFLKSERSSKTIYPPEDEVFNAFNYTSFKNVKVVIIGQDPYHGDGQAHGISFSVKKGNKVPPSLKNMYKELVSDLNDFQVPDHGYLEPWATQGVLMLNSVLTVEKSNPASHRKKGWEEFTDKVIEVLNDQKDHLVFILWGNDAKKKGLNVDRTKHLVLESAHPSPFSVKKFYGCKHFSKTNEYLIKNDLDPINWNSL